jgi:hypothetical protein
MNVYEIIEDLPIEEKIELIEKLTESINKIKYEKEWIEEILRREKNKKFVSYDSVKKILK